MAPYGFSESAASPGVAERFTNAIVRYCVGLREFLHRGLRCEDIRPGLLVTNYQCRVVTAYAVDAESVSIVELFYEGRSFEALLHTDTDD